MSRTAIRALAAGLAAGTALLGLAGCGPSSTGGSASSSSSSSSAAASPAAPTDAAGLAALLRTGLATVRSAHLNMTVGAAGVSLTGTGDETISGGRLRSVDLTENVPSAGKLRIVMIGGETWLQLPASLNSSGKPWVLVTPSSRNPVIRRLATMLESIRQTASLDQFTTFSSVATVTAHDPETVDGAPATHYELTVDVAKLPDTLPGKQQLIDAGLASMPVELWIDQRGRPVKFTEQFAARGKQISTLVTISRYDQPVTVTPPPADQVSTD